jgi:hypothetical protein
MSDGDVDDVIEAVCDIVSKKKMPERALNTDDLMPESVARK